MRAKEYLSQVRFLDERITCKLADAARLQDMATRITPILREDGVSGAAARRIVWRTRWRKSST